MGDSVLAIGLYTRAVNSIQSNEDVRVSKRLFLPSSRLRGFEAGKIGPKDGADFVGGNYMASFNTALTLPFLFQSFDNVDFAIFYDAANVWHVDYDSLVDQGNSIRSAAGVAVDVITPVGPLSFSLSKPITKKSVQLKKAEDMKRPRRGKCANVHKHTQPEGSSYMLILL